MAAANSARGTTIHIVLSGAPCPSRSHSESICMRSKLLLVMRPFSTMSLFIIPLLARRVGAPPLMRRHAIDDERLTLRAADAIARSEQHIGRVVEPERIAIVG